MKTSSSSTFRHVKLSMARAIVMRKTVKQEEFGLFIIWENARPKEKKIINDVSKRFKILNIFDVTWDKDKFSDNLTRFYGENLPPDSFKEKHCGNGEFVLLVLKDNNPVYTARPTSHGMATVNANFFDSKEMYRKWTGAHMVHGTNDQEEFKHDLVLLLGVNIEDYLLKYEMGKRYSIHSNIVGASGWDSLKEMFYVLNETVPYVVLRNFSELPVNYQLGEHSDIDILTADKFKFSLIANGSQAYRNKKRAKYIVKVADSFVNADVRSIGDNYYDRKWEADIIKTRDFRNNIFVPNEKNYIYSLIYHALFQKNKISDTYISEFNKFFGESDAEQLRDHLLKFMDENAYAIVTSEDYSVFFNAPLAGKRGSIIQQLYYKHHRLFRRVDDMELERLKSLLRKIRNRLRNKKYKAEISIHNDTPIQFSHTFMGEKFTKELSSRGVVGVKAYNRNSWHYGYEYYTGYLDGTKVFIKYNNKKSWIEHEACNFYIINQCNLRNYAPKFFFCKDYKRGAYLVEQFLDYTQIEKVSDLNKSNVDTLLNNLLSLLECLQESGFMHLDLNIHNLLNLGYKTPIRDGENRVAVAMPKAPKNHLC